MMGKVILCALIPFVGTVLGSGMVFLLKKDINPSMQKGLLGFASGVMIAASVWSLLIPSIEMAGSGLPVWVPAAAGFLIGIVFLLLLDTFIPHLHLDSDKPEGKAVRLGKSQMLILAVTLHNIPEGMAVGVVLSGMLSGSELITAAGALSLAVGIAIQNFPEGAIVSMPLVKSGLSKNKAFVFGALSGAVEPVAALLMVLLSSFLKPLLPFMLSFAAGAMFYVVVEELIPEAQSGEHSNIGTIGASLGFVLMMILDVALG